MPTNLELRYKHSRLNAPLDYFDKKDTRYFSYDRVEFNLYRLSNYVIELKNQAELAISYAKGLQSRIATTEELETLEKACLLIHEIIVRHTITMNLLM